MQIALLGLGVVGGGVWELMQGRPGWEVRRAMARSPHQECGGKVVDSIEPILEDSEVELVVEAIGGIHPAYQYVAAALRAGKHVVTANKALMAAHYGELTAMARENGVVLRCTGAVGGGIPFLPALERARRLDRIVEISGILNGTTNYILDLMTREGKDFAEALSAAQALGYAEADPSADIDGLDLQNKLALCANVAFGVMVQAEDIPTAGIRGITAEDVEFFSRAGLVCKLIGSAQNKAGRISALVEPTLLPQQSPEAGVLLNNNRICFRGERLGSQSFSGQGAGRYPTAINVLQDCLDIEAGCSGFYTEASEPRSVDNSEIRKIYYLRTDYPDRFRDCIAGPLGPGFVTNPVPVSRIYDQVENCRFLAAISEPVSSQHIFQNYS